jgi:hypothetical protein
MSYKDVGFATRMGAGDMPPAKRFANGSSILVIDSDDRNVSTTLGLNPLTGENQPWNDFQITLPDRLVTGSINSLMLKELVMPWAIPNITTYNNTMVIASTSTPNPFQYNITLTPGFYQPSDIATAINTQITTQGAGGMGVHITVQWDAVSSYFDWGAIDIEGQTVTFEVEGIPAIPQYIQNPSLMKTMGFSYAQFAQQLSVPIGNNNFLFSTGSTSCLYTSYVDIVSTRLNQYRKLQDGASKNASRQPFVTRVYCANETSMNPSSGNPVGTEYFVINRQFREKVIAWSPEGTIDSLDFRVYDQYGNLVWLPSQSYNPAIWGASVYPGFKMTFKVVSEE